ncbi:MAG: mannose-1-phosphate guanylyltransferase [Paludibacteraceae bacterium]|nr:mannose-1-phosphate guanylyltransferase [Paludibacteraceae bacterium]
MAGGVGSRFWPFSRNQKPKQFLDFFGTGRSLLQMTIDRFRPIVPIENILIVTNVLYRDQVLEQIPDLKAEQVLCEPARRNTAPCIAYAAARIKAMAKGEKAKIVVAPSDHLILQEETFRQTIQQGFDFIEKNDALLTLGMKPTRPETGYGYIQMGEGASPQEAKGEMICKVKAFTEKPNLELAKVFLESGDFLWNSGIFIWSLNSILNAFNEFLPEMANKFAEGENVMGTPNEDAFIQTMFPTCPSISIDYGVMEKAKNVYVIPSDFGWSDLGTWGSLYDLSEKDENQNVTLHSDATYYDSHGNIVTLPKGHLAVVQGLEDCIVAESNGVLLICKREAEQQIRQFFMDAEVRFEGKFS